MNLLSSIREKPWRIELSPAGQLVALLTGFLSGVAAVAAVAAAAFTAAFMASASSGSFAALRSPLVSNAILFIVQLGVTLAALNALPPAGPLAEKIGCRKLKLADLKVIASGLVAIYLFHFAVSPLWGKALDALGVNYAESQSLMVICKNATVLRFIGLLALAGVLIPLTEELVFRRLLFGMLCPLGPHWALLLTSLVFSAMHFYLYGFWALWFLGLVFQYIYLKTGNLLASAVAHIVFNVISLAGGFCSGAR